MDTIRHGVTSRSLQYQSLAILCHMTIILLQKLILMIMFNIDLLFVEIPPGLNAVLYQQCVKLCVIAQDTEPVDLMGSVLVIHFGKEQTVRIKHMTPLLKGSLMSHQMELSGFMS